MEKEANTERGNRVKSGREGRQRKGRTIYEQIEDAGKKNTQKDKKKKNLG